MILVSFLIVVAFGTALGLALTGHGSDADWVEVEDRRPRPRVEVSGQ